jgi:lysozyme
MPYRDTRGLLSIGVGRCLDRVGISSSEANDLLANDLMRATNQVTKSFPWATQLDDQRLDVLIELVFWLGLGGVLEFKLMLAALQDGDYPEASLQLMASSLPAEAPNRVSELAQILRTGESSF